MTAFQTLAILLTFAALGAYINKRFLRLPATIGLMFVALVMSLLAIGFNQLGWIDLRATSSFVAHIDFSAILLHGMLSFLLFAGAMHVDLAELRKYKTLVGILATLGVVMATFITGSLVWLAAGWLGFSFPYIYALLFGALISPTDPVAVLGILKETGISKSLRVQIGGESLLNDGVAVVLFLILLAIANPHMSKPSPPQIAFILAWAGIGGIALGLALGWLTFQALHSINDYKIEVMMTLALAAGGYALAEFVHVSGPLAMVAAGLILGNHGGAFGTSPKNRKHLDMFWEMLDETLNAVLFMLVGLEMMVITITSPHLAMGLIAIIAVLVGRFISVGLPVFIGRFRYKLQRGTIRLMTWGGLRGGIAIALALSLPPGPEKDLILGMTYLVVIFSVLFQGTTFRHLAQTIAHRG
ncbi:MAG: sodium:proton antiporter [Alphaproteobacteria bacterium]|nr:sodium:proton antiporter [Alphaproteobacteria bacterium]